MYVEYGSTEYFDGYPKRLAEFQRRFIPYFPEFRDLNIAEFEMSWLENRVFGNPLETVRHKPLLAELHRMEACIQQLASFYIPNIARVSFDRFTDRTTDREIMTAEGQLLDGLFVLRDLDDKGLLRRAVASLRKRIESAAKVLPATRNVNWEAVHAIDGLRILWLRNTGKEAPARALNPASQFAAFLQEGFKFLDIAANVASAFRRWAAFNQTRQE